MRAHRYALALATGEPLGSALALHECDVPVCVKVAVPHAIPQHVIAGTQRDNMIWMAYTRRGGGRPVVAGRERICQQRARSVAPSAPRSPRRGRCMARSAGGWQAEGPWREPRWRGRPSPDGARTRAPRRAAGASGAGVSASRSLNAYAHDCRSTSNCPLLQSIPRLCGTHADSSSRRLDPHLRAPQRAASDAKQAGVADDAYSGCE